jgi:hypothetical protein
MGVSGPSPPAKAQNLHLQRQRNPHRPGWKATLVVSTSDFNTPGERSGLVIQMTEMTEISAESTWAAFVRRRVKQSSLMNRFA